jgi:glutamyl-tRNA reductase
VTLINRTRKKAEEFKYCHAGIVVADHEELNDQIAKTDILIVSTGANKPTIGVSQIEKGKNLLILDLSMPENVDIVLKERPEIELVNVDELSKITDKTIETRKKEIPAAQKIIDNYKAEFNEWISHRKFVPAVNALKESLIAIQHDEIDFHARKIKDFNVEHAEFVTSRMIQKITTQFVKHLKSDNTSVDQSINVIGQIFNQEKVEI